MKCSTFMLFLFLLTYGIVPGFSGEEIMGEVEQQVRGMHAPAHSKQAHSRSSCR